jgi:lysophospholipase L1-like esterase
MTKKGFWLKVLLIILCLTNAVTLFCFGYVAIHDKVPERIFAALGITKNPGYTVTSLPDYWIEALERLRSKKDGFKAVMLGDSITAGGDWYTLLNGYDVANFGIGGDTTVGILNRMDGIYMTRPKRVFLMIGINDFGTGATVETTYANYTEIVNSLLDKNIEVVLQSTLYVAKSISGYNEINRKVTDLNAFIKKLAVDKGLNYINLNEVLCEDNLLESRYTKDGIHLNNAGYKQWANAMRTFIE